MAPRGACLRAPRASGARESGHRAAGRTPTTRRHARAGPPPPQGVGRGAFFSLPGHLGSRHEKGLPNTTKMEPADEELQQLTAPPARAPRRRARAVIGCVALASTALLFAATNTTKTKVSPAVLAAREIVKNQIAARDPAPGAGHGPGDADTAHDVDNCSDPCIPCTNAGSLASRRSSSTSWSTTRRRRPTAESFLRTAASTARRTRRTPQRPEHGFRGRRAVRRPARDVFDFGSDRGW